MPYIISSNEVYLFQDANGFKIVDSLDKATTWDKVVKVNNVFKTISASSKFSKYNLEVKYVQKENNKLNEPAFDTQLTYNLYDKVQELAEFASQIEQRRLYLIEKIHEVDLEIVDIEHAAEYKLNAYQGYKLYKLLHNARIKRRAFKNEMQKIDYILGTTINSTRLENLQSTLKGLDNRKYAPRVIKELFKNKEEHNE